MRFAAERVVITCVCAALAAAGCEDGSVSPASPSAGPAVTGVAAIGSFPRSGTLHVTKTCAAYGGQAGDTCTIESSNVEAVARGSRVIYAQAADFGTLTLDSDVVLDLPGPGRNTASGHCQLNLATGIGRCTFSGGTGKFKHFKATADVSFKGGFIYAWDGTYTFDPGA